MSEKYVCNGCNWLCTLSPNTEIIHMPKKCPFIEGEMPFEIKPQWHRDCRR